MPAVGTQGWLDLTVDQPEALVSFYADVLGWTPSPVDMSDDTDSWQDHAMLVDGAAVAGICHRRGPNAGMPAGWVPYFVVADLGAAMARAEERGAARVDVREKMAVLRDPAGSVFALWQGS